MADEKTQNSTPAESSTPVPAIPPSPNIPGPQPKYEATPSAQNVNVDYNRKRKLRVGLLVLMAFLLGATAGGYAYLYQTDQQIISKLNNELATNSAPKTKTSPSPSASPKVSAVVRSNTKLAASANPQVLTIKEWEVKLVLPNEAFFPKPSYAVRAKDPSGNESVGLSNGNLSKYGGTCVASGAPLGILVRMKAGSFPTGGSSVNYIATISGYDYGFISPQSVCDKAPPEANATSVSALHEVIGALNTLDTAN